MSDKKRIFSGIQPSGYPTLGNYVGAIKNWAALSRRFECVFSVVDMHAVTVRQNPDELRRKAVEMFALLAAAGIDPEKHVVYFQSHVPAHAELAWILGCHTYMGELSRMTQFKDKSARHADNINAGLFTYPVLMAADILLYQADLVPVGEDQKQHIELTRDVAERFNNLYGDIFTIPEGYILEVGARIMSLQEPDKKMSKSDTANPGNVVSLLDPPDIIMKKFKRAVTDSGADVRYAADKPGVSNLLTIYAAMTGRTIPEAEAEFAGFGYGAFKAAVGESVVAAFKPLREEFERLLADQGYLDGIIRANAGRAAALAAPTIARVKRAVGFSA
ncbi:MAG: tryptophan--tRNA ligase [Clostridiales bacterium]|nr:tryptophan--tRNA ligase [Clostridiales bacterium]